MNKPPEHIAPAKFCATESSFTGRLSLAHFARLSSMLAAGNDGVVAGEVECSMRGQVDAARRRLLIGHVTADLPVVCQTCFGPMTVHVDHDFELCVVRSEEDAEQFAGDEEPVVCEGDELNAHDLFEDELILSLPVVVNHPAEQCQIPPDVLHTGEDDEPEVPDRENPFASLSVLKKSGKT